MGKMIVDALFQSTRSLRGGTAAEVLERALLEFQSTRPLRGGNT